MAEKNNHTSIGFDDELKARIEANLSGSQSISQFTYDSVVEKCNRMDKRNEQAKAAAFLRDVKAFKPVVMAIIVELKQEGII